MIHPCLYKLQGCRMDWGSMKSQCENISAKPKAKKKINKNILKKCLLRRIFGDYNDHAYCYEYILLKNRVTIYTYICIKCRKHVNEMSERSLWRNLPLVHVKMFSRCTRKKFIFFLVLKNFFHCFILLPLKFKS